MNRDQLSQEISDHLALQIRLNSVHGRTCEEYIEDVVSLINELKGEQDREIAKELAIKGSALLLQVGIILAGEIDRSGE